MGIIHTTQKRSTYDRAAKKDKASRGETQEKDFKNVRDGWQANQHF